MKTSELDFELPKRLIAQQGLTDRTGSRLLVLRRPDGGIEHRRFTDVAEYLESGDCLVVNESKVIAARFFTRRETGGRIEGLFLEPIEGGRWQVLLKNAGRLRLGELVTLERRGTDARKTTGNAVRLRAVAEQGEGRWVVQPELGGDYLKILGEYGCTPLPPYIQRPAEEGDQQRYQTVYARTPGSVAAPTAGLHFSEELLEQVAGRGVQIARVTLHVGLGTFKGVDTDRLEDHPMHWERYSIGEDDAGVINEAAARGGRIVAVGTTSVRTLESVAQGRQVKAGTGATRLFITPGYEFKIVDGMITNFHLPRTTLLALVCSFAGTEAVLAAYRAAVRKEYRFFSYGDAMLLT